MPEEDRARSLAAPSPAARVAHPASTLVGDGLAVLRALGGAYGRGRVRPRLPVPVRPIELGRRLVREMDDHRTRRRAGPHLVPNDFTFHLSQKDHDGFAESTTRSSGSCARPREYAGDEGYGLMGPVTVELLADPGTKPGRFGIASRDGRAEGPRHRCVLPTGDRDPRRQTVPHRAHAGVRHGHPPTPTSAAATPRSGPWAPTFVLVDLGSTNGTKVNGATIAEHTLAAGRHHQRRRHDDPVRGVLSRDATAVPEQLLGLLKLCLLALLYLFFARVLWAVWTEVRAVRPQTAGRRRRSDRRAPAAGAARGTQAGPAGRAGRAAPPDRRPQPPSRQGHALRARRPEMTIGRAAGCHVAVADDTFASQLHARVFGRDGAVFVEDLGSTNGTYVNGARLAGPDGAAAGRPAPGRQHRPGGVVTLPAGRVG